MQLPPFEIMVPLQAKVEKRTKERDALYSKPTIDFCYE
jgi:hypothetical protein